MGLLVRQFCGGFCFVFSPASEYINPVDETGELFVLDPESDHSLPLTLNFGQFSLFSLP